MRLASTAREALRVDLELSPLVRRSLTTISPLISHHQDPTLPDVQENILRIEYKAKTNRLLRVAFNGFMESLNVVIRTMEELDVDVIDTKAVLTRSGHGPEDFDSS